MSRSRRRVEEIQSPRQLNLRTGELLSSNNRFVARHRKLASEIIGLDVNLGKLSSETLLLASRTAQLERSLSLETIEGLRSLFQVVFGRCKLGRELGVGTALISELECLQTCALLGLGS